MGAEADKSQNIVHEQAGSKLDAAASPVHADSSSKLFDGLHPLHPALSSKAQASDHQGSKSKAEENARIIKLLEPKVEHLANLPKPSDDSKVFVPHQTDFSQDDNFWNTKESCYGSITVKVPFMSSRELTTNKDGNLELSGNVGDKENYGTIDVTIPLTKEMYDTRTAAQVPEWVNGGTQCFKPTMGKLNIIDGEEKFLEEVKKEYDSSSVKNLLFIEPGFHTSIAKELREAAELRAHGIPVVLNSWPSGGKVVDYPKDSWNSRIDMTTHTSEMLDHLSNLVGAPNMSVLGFSMGANEIDEYMNVRSKISAQLPHELPRFKNIFFVHADSPAAVTAYHLDATAKNANEVDYFGAKTDLALKASMSLHGGIVPTGMAGAGIFAKFKNGLPNVKYYDDESYQHPYLYHSINVPLLAAKLKYGTFGPEVHQTSLNSNGPSITKLDRMP